MSNPTTQIKTEIINRLNEVLTGKHVIEWIRDDSDLSTQLQQQAYIGDAGFIYVTFAGSDGSYQEPLEPLLTEQMTIELFVVESQSSGDVSSKDLDQTCFEVKKALNKLNIETVGINDTDTINCVLKFVASTDIGYTNGSIIRLTNIQQWKVNYTFD